MFDIAWSEFLVVAVVALVVVGPKDLPALLRTVGKTVASLRRMAGDFQSQFNEAMREAELDDFKNDITGLKDTASRFTGSNPFQIARDELKNALDSRPTPSALAGAAPGSNAVHDAPSALAPAPEIASFDEPPPPAADAFAPPEFERNAEPAKAPANSNPEATPEARSTRKAAVAKSPAKSKAPERKSPKSKTSTTPGASA